MPEAPGEVPGMIDELFAIGNGTELGAMVGMEVPGMVVLLSPVTGEPGVLLLMPVEYAPERD